MVEQSDWRLLDVTSYSDSGVYVDLYPSIEPIPGTSQNQKRTFKVDFVLIRNVIKEPMRVGDHTNKFLALMHGKIPSVNSLFSVYCCLEKPILYGALKEIQTKLGKKEFPLIKQYFYSSFRTAIIAPHFPNVAKIGHSHAGYGKMKLEDSEQFEDLLSVVALDDHYLSMESFISSTHELRIQKIGEHYRVFKRFSEDWKINRSAVHLEDTEMTERYKLWIDECAQIFGGLELCALDVLVNEDGTETILELNDTGMGLNYKPEEDHQYVKEVVIDKMRSLFQ